MRIALFGGTFNPVHHGHLLIAEDALHQYKLDRVLFIPAGIPPHKKAPRTSFKHRLAMLTLATQHHPAFSVSDWEARQKRVVYTYETLTHFKSLQSNKSIYFLLGSDAMKHLSKWRKASLLRRMARFVPAPRIDPFASSDIRKRVRRGQSVRFRVPESVEKYIRTHRLYRVPE